MGAKSTTTSNHPSTPADKQFKFNIIGETTFIVTRDNHKLRYDALIATDLE